jgi:hypothetical protein
MLTARLATESTKVQPEQYVEQDLYEDWSENTETDESFFEDLPASSGVDLTHSQTVVPASYNVQNEESWEYVPKSNPQAYKSGVKEEREVFEL